MAKLRQTHKMFRDTHVEDGDRVHLDPYNNAWLYADGSVDIRSPGNMFENVGSVAHLHGAARVSKALSLVFAHRGF